MAAPSPRGMPNASTPISGKTFQWVASGVALGVASGAAGVASGVASGASNVANVATWTARGARDALGGGHLSYQDQFCQACYDGKLSEVNILYSSGEIDVNMFGQVKHRAAKSHDSSSGLTLLHPAALSSFIDRHTGRSPPRPPAIHAAEKGQLDILRRLAEWHADLNQADDEGFTPAHWAARANRVHTLRVLAELGVQLDVRNIHGQTPYDIALAMDRRPVLNVWQELVELCEESRREERPKCIERIDLSTPMDVHVGSNKLIPRLSQLRNSAAWSRSVRVQDTRSFLQAIEEFRVAILKKDLETVKSLHELGEVPNINATVRFGNTPAMYAAEVGSEEILKLLHGWGAVMSCQNNTKNQPAHFAALNDHSGCLGLLKSLGADLDARDMNGKTPAHAAASKGNLLSLKVLARLGADLTATDNRGFTPKCCAIRAGNQRLVDIFPSLLKLSEVMRWSNGITNQHSDPTTRTAMGPFLRSRRFSAPELQAPSTATPSCPPTTPSPRLQLTQSEFDSRHSRCSPTLPGTAATDTQAETPPEHCICITKADIKSTRRLTSLTVFTHSVPQPRKPPKQRGLLSLATKPTTPTAPDAPDPWKLARKRGGSIRQLRSQNSRSPGTATPPASRPPSV